VSGVDYSQCVRARFSWPARAGVLPDGPGEHLWGEAEALERRAWVRFEVRVQDGQIADGRFRAWGCPYVVAACDLALERLQGRPLSAAAGLDARTLATELEAPADKLGRLLVVEDALRALAAGRARDT